MQSFEWCVCSAEDQGVVSPVAVDTSRHHSSVSTLGLDAEQTYLGMHLQAAEVGRNTWRHRALVDAAAAAARFRLAGRLRDGVEAGLRFGAHRAHLLAQLPHLLHLELAERKRLKTAMFDRFLLRRWSPSRCASRAPFPAVAASAVPVVFQGNTSEQPSKCFRAGRCVSAARQFAAGKQHVLQRLHLHWTPCVGRRCSEWRVTWAPGEGRSLPLEFEDPSAGTSAAMPPARCAAAAGDSGL